jgi:hypothetical protein
MTMLDGDRFDDGEGPGSTPCERFGPDIVALVRGEDAADVDPAVLEHRSSCADCRALADEAAQVFRAAAARPAPVPFAGFDPVARRAAVAGVVTRALATARDAEHEGVPAPALFEVVSRRYGESRLVRFLSLSAGLHAAAAAFLGAWLYLSPSSPFQRREQSTVVGVNTEQTPQLEGNPNPVAPPHNRDIFGTNSNVDFPGSRSLPEHTGLRPFDEAPRPDFGGDVAIYAWPTPAFGKFASPRFLSQSRRRLMDAVYGEEGSRAAADAVHRGLRRLAARQELDGTWVDPATAGGASGRRGADTAAALRSFLAEGETALRRGTYSELVRRGVEALAQSRDPGSGLLGAVRDARGQRLDAPTLVDHASVLSTLAEAYGLDYGLLPEDVRGRWRALLADAVSTVVAAQRPDGSFGLDGRAGDTHTTLSQVEALAMARMAGIAVDGAVLDRAGAFVRSRIDAKGTLGLLEPGDRGQDASLAARALLLSEPLALTADQRTLMRGFILEDASGDPLKGRSLFRADLLELVAAFDDQALRALWGPNLSRSAVSSLVDGTETGEQGTHATAATVRGLTAPYRCAP